MVVGAGLVEYCAGLEESSGGEVSRACSTEEVRCHGPQRTGSSVRRRQRVDVQDRHGQAAQRQGQHQLWPGLVTVCFGGMC